MLNIQGAIQIIPDSVSAEPGKLQIADEAKNAVIITLLTQSGPVQVIIPSEFVGDIADGLKEAADKSTTESPDLYVPQGGMSEVHEIAKAKENIETQVGKK